jgi:hypothetical protein
MAVEEDPRWCIYYSLVGMLVTWTLLMVVTVATASVLVVPKFIVDNNTGALVAACVGTFVLTFWACTAFLAGILAHPRNNRYTDV